MSGASAAPAVPPGAVPVAIPVPVESSSFWDRATTWASENKAVIYTIAGVTLVVTGAGVVYYLNNDSVSRSAAGAFNRAAYTRFLADISIFASLANHDTVFASTETQVRLIPKAQQEGTKETERGRAPGRGRKGHWFAKGDRAKATTCGHGRVG